MRYAVAHALRRSHLALIGLVGVALSLVIGITLGGMSGNGGLIDMAIQPIEVISAFLITGYIAAALPRDWTTVRSIWHHHYSFLVRWTDLARDRTP